MANHMQIATAGLEFYSGSTPALEWLISDANPVRIPPEAGMYEIKPLPPYSMRSVLYKEFGNYFDTQVVSPRGLLETMSVAEFVGGVGMSLALSGDIDPETATTENIANICFAIGEARTRAYQQWHNDIDKHIPSPPTVRYSLFRGNVLLGGHNG